MEIYQIKVSADVATAQVAVEKLKKSIQESGEEAKTSGDLLKRLDTITLSAIIDQVRGIADGLKELTTPAIDFEQSMADLSAITGSVGEELEDLKKTARAVGAESGLGAAESARAFAVLAGQIDVPIDSLKTLQKQTILLAQAGAIPLETAANALAGTINQFGMEASEASRIVNVLAAASRAGGAEVNDIAESFKVSGAAAASAGVSVEETAGALEVLAQNNTKGAEAGTALRNMLIAMQARLGIDISKTGFAGGLRILQGELSKMGTQTEKTAFLAKAFGRENIVAAQYLLENASAVEEMTQAVTNSNAAQEQAEIRTATWAHHMEVAQAKMNELKIAIVEATGGLLPFGSLVAEQLVPLAQLTPLINGIGGAVKMLGRSLISSGVGGIAVAIGAIVGALVVAYNTSEEFRKACDELFGVLKQIAGSLMQSLKPAFDAVWNAVKPILPMFAKLASLVANQLSRVLVQLSPILGVICKLTGAILELLAPILGLIIGIVGRVLNALIPVLEPLFKIFADNNPFVQLFSDILSGVAHVIETVVGWIAKLINGLKNLLGLGDEAKNMADSEGSNAASSTVPSYTPPAKPEIDLSQYNTNFSLPDYSKETSTATKKVITDLETIEGLQNAINQAQEKLNRAKGDEAVALQRTVNQLQDQLDYLQSSIKKAAEPLKKVDAQGITTLKGYHANALEKAKGEGKEVKGGRIIASVLGMESASKAIDDFQKKVNKLTLDHLKGEGEKWKNLVSGIQDGLGGVASIMSSMGDVVGGSAGTWIKWGASVVSAIAQALPKLLALFNANVATATSGAAASQSSVPIVGPMMAIASVASILAAIANPPKATAFAEGGILYGATYALAGEYPGASNNPEVIAPLDRLPSLLGTDKLSQGSSEVSFKIRGRELIGILNKELKTTRLS